MPSRKIPAYRLHKARNLAVVRIDGKDVYLGEYDSPESKAKYERLVADWLKSHHERPEAGATITVCELMASYLAFAVNYYVKDGKPTREFGCISEAMRIVRKAFEDTPVSDFGPRALKSVRDEMISLGWSRKYINKQVGRIVRMFKWGVAEEIVPATIQQALAAVPGLRKGRTEACDHAPVLPVLDEQVEKTLAVLTPVLADMVRLQRLSGGRPGEIVQMRPMDIDRTGDVWAYRPSTHKTEHQSRSRVLFFGPRSQQVLAKYLDREPTAYCFSPQESEKMRRDELHQRRTTPLKYGNRPRQHSRTGLRRPASRYTTGSYRRAIHRACEQKGIPKWCPNRIRHTAATEIRHKFGLEAAQTVLGHASAAVTQIYAERDLALAASIARELGYARFFKGDFDGALTDFNETLKIDPSHAGAQIDLALLMGTCPDEKLRDGKHAVEYATKACKKVNWKGANWLDILAAAYAESGDFDKAVEWQQKAIEQAAPKDMAEFESRLKLYQNKKPYRQPALQ